MKSYGYTNSYSGLDCTGLVKWAIGVGCNYVGWKWQSYRDGVSSKGDFSEAKPGILCLLDILLIVCIID